MLRLSVVFVFLVLSFSLIVANEPEPEPVPDDGVQEQTEAPVIWCTTSDEEQKKCNDISKKAGTFTLNWSNLVLQCIQRQTTGECLYEVSQGTATIMGVCSKFSYYAGNQYGLLPLLAEKYRNEPEGVQNIDYAAVAVIRKDNNRINSVEDLRGAKSCHSYVGKHSGWNVPLSLLIEKGILTGDDCLNNIKNVDHFFSQSCAPRRKTVEADADLCDLCAGTGDANCTAEDPYAGNLGAFKCLQDNKGDVAFIKHDAVAEATAGGTTPGQRKSDYELLCPDGTKKPVDEYRDCNWGLVPTRTLMASPKVGRYQRYAHKRFFFHVLNVTDPELLFNSTLYNGTDLMFSDRAIDLYDPKAVYYTDFMGPTFIRTYENQTLNCQADTPSQMRWCTSSKAENAKCNQMKLAFDSTFIKPRVVCVSGQDSVDCTNRIRSGEVDLLTLDSGDLYNAGKTNEVIPLLYEDYGKADARYWAVAVAKASDPTVTFTNLRGRKSCHTGIPRTAGWKVPVASLISSHQITVDDPCDVLADVGSYFNESCAPGALDPQYIPRGGESSENLCKLCKGEGVNRCARNDGEPYYGYTGAFRCLVEGGGDVAFINHLTALENTDGNNKENWAKDLKSADYVLLCPDGTRQPISNFKDCNLARVPAHTVVTSSSKTEIEKNAFIKALSKGQKIFGDDDNKKFRLFDSPAGSKDLLFRDGTIQLLPVPENQRTMQSWLGTFLPTVELSNRCK
ncbi:antigen p97 (melanoma associated) identified by monoclonal antibodies 133.2 and 96.5 [Chamberlinius hualienensis]